MVGAFGETERESSATQHVEKVWEQICEQTTQYGLAPDISVEDCALWGDSS
jgi:hypothetical protein